MTDIQFGLDTFGDVPSDDTGNPSSYAHGDPAGRRRGGPGRSNSASMRSRSVSTTGRSTRSRPRRPCSPASPPAPRVFGWRSGVTVLSSDDPVRVFQRFATVDALSNGRAEVILGPRLVHRVVPAVRLRPARLRHAVRGEARPVRQTARRAAGHLEWHGSRRRCGTPTCSPRPSPGRLTTWVGVGGSPQSVVRTARYGLPLMLAIIGGPPERFAPYLELYRRAAEQFGTIAHPVGMHSPGFVADTDEEARELFWPHYKVMRDRIGALRGWPPIRREEFNAEIEHGSMYVGSPETVARQDRPRDRQARGRPLRPHLLRRRAPGRRAAARSRALRRQGHPDGPRHPRRPARAHRPLTDDPPNGRR